MLIHSTLVVGLVVLAGRTNVTFSSEIPTSLFFTREYLLQHTVPNLSYHFLYFLLYNIFHLSSSTITFLFLFIFIHPKHLKGVHERDTFTSNIDFIKFFARIKAKKNETKKNLWKDLTSGNGGGVLLCKVEIDNAMKKSKMHIGIYFFIITFRLFFLEFLFSFYFLSHVEFNALILYSLYFTYPYTLPFRESKCRRPLVDLYICFFFFFTKLHGSSFSRSRALIIYSTT